MSDDTGLVFVIDGAEYPAPKIRSFGMAERRVMFELADIIEEDFSREEGETDAEHETRLWKLTRHAGYMEALMHIAYQRGNQDMKRAQVQDVIDRTNYQDAIQKWGAAQDDDAGNPALESTSKPSETSSSGTSDSSKTTGDDSTTGSDSPDKTHASIGTGRSDTSRIADRKLSAA